MKNQIKFLLLMVMLSYSCGSNKIDEDILASYDHLQLIFRHQYQMKKKPFWSWEGSAAYSTNNKYFLIESTGKKEIDLTKSLETELAVVFSERANHEIFLGGLTSNSFRIASADHISNQWILEVRHNNNSYFFLTNSEKSQYLGENVKGFKKSNSKIYLLDEANHIISTLE